MDIVTLSRIQFGVTTAFHFLFVPLTLGLVWFVAIFRPCIIELAKNAIAGCQSFGASCSW